MVNIKKIIRFLLLFSTVPVLCSQQKYQTGIPLHFDKLFPETHFTKIEGLCKDLWSDLDLLNVNPELRKTWLEYPDPLLNQCLELYVHIEELAHDTQEARIYLADDIRYLVTICNLLEEKYLQLRTTLSEQQKDSDMIVTIGILLQKGRNELENILSKTYEVIGTQNALAMSMPHDIPLVLVLKILFPPTMRL